MSHHAKVLRFDPRLSEVDTVRARRRFGSPIIDVEIYAAFGACNPRMVATTAVVYGRDVAERRERLGLPWSLARGGETTWHLESCQLLDAWPRTSWLLVDVPAEIGDAWTWPR